MSASDYDKRAEELVKDAQALDYKKDNEKADVLLRKALQLAPTNPLVLSEYRKLKGGLDLTSVTKACMNLAFKGDTSDLFGALQYLTDPTQPLGPSALVECLSTLFIDVYPEHKKLIDSKLVTEILKRSIGKTEVMPICLEESEKRLAILNGVCALQSEEVAHTMAKVLTDRSGWKSPTRRKDACKAYFRILREKLSPSAKSDFALSAVARLLMADIEMLEDLVNQATLEFLLDRVGSAKKGKRGPPTPESRSLATLALARIFEVKDGVCQSMFNKYLTEKLGEDGDFDLMCAYEAMAVVFSIAPKVAAKEFLENDFVESLVPSLDGRSTRVEKTALDMLSAAASAPAETNCRESIKIHCMDFLVSIMNANDESKALAATILTKLDYGTKKETGPSVEELSTVFQDLMVQDDVNSQKKSLEGLAYASLKPAVKESIIKNEKLIQNLISILKKGAEEPMLAYPALIILQNLTAYPRALTEEQKKMAQLKGYANAEKLQDEEAKREKEETVTTRCDSLVRSGVAPALCLKNPSESSAALIANTFLALARNQKNRGKIAQQGAIGQLLHVYEVSNSHRTKYTAAHALARILISLDPSLAFGGRISELSAIPPLILLLTPPEEDETVDLLPVFESFMALTNLASSPNDTIRQKILQLGWDKVEENMLAKNERVRRAATQLICNLMDSPFCVEKFADGSKNAEVRLGVLTLLTDSEDLETRLAAGGALAQFLQYEPCIKIFLPKPKALPYLLRMLKDEDQGVVHRGIICLLNLLTEGGKEAKDAIKEKNGEEVVLAALKAHTSPQLLESGVEIVKILRMPF